MTSTTQTEWERNSLSGLARTVTAALGELVTSDGRLRDPGTQDGWSPADHYGHLSTALALYLTDSTDDRVALLLDHWLAQPAERGHGPFNRLLGKCLLDAALRAQDKTIAARAMRVPAAAKLKRDYPSNNWRMLAQLCRILESTTTQHRDQATRKLIHLYRRWMTNAGAFTDFPKHAYQRGEGATPICYHHKALFVATVALLHTENGDLALIVEELLAWALMTSDGEGYAGGFGRSTHALFGDSCLLFALRVLAQVTDKPTALEKAETTLVRRLGRQRRPDGLLELNPAGSGGWDGYMHLSVYNAWAAALFTWAPSAAAGCSAMAGRLKLKARPAPQEDTDAGLHRIDDPAACVLLISSRGQPAQALGRSEIELRYAGGAPFHMSLNGLPRIAPPARLSLTDTLADPALAGWVPLLQYEGTVFIAAYDCVRRHSHSNGAAIEMSGYPVPAILPLPQGLSQRVLHAIDWRFFDGRLARRSGLKRPRQRRIHIELTLNYEPARQTLEQTLHIHNNSTISLRLLNPGGHALLDSTGDVEVSFASNFAERKHLWRATGLPASLPGATGYCLDPTVVCAGKSFTQRLAVRWPA